jgi:hypothetical protein
MKYLILTLMIFFGIESAKCQNRDTVVIYYNNSKFYPVKRVSTLDSADYFRIIYPPNSAATDSLYTVKEFYKSGKIKFIGQLERQGSVDYPSNVYLLKGTCISFYLDGKKRSISSYTYGKKLGFEYFLKPNGHIGYVENWVENSDPNSNTKLYWECYDENGNQICKNGEGKWIIFTKDYSHILLEGQIKNGSMYGEWKGSSMQSDSIKYICNYKRGFLVSAYGYDKNGILYPFKMEKEAAKYKGGTIFDFVNSLINHLPLHKDASGARINIDTVHIMIIIGKDGHLTQLDVMGNVSTELKTALKLAATKCNDWIPSKYFGIPFPTQIVLPLKIERGYMGNFYFQSILIKSEFLNLQQDIDFNGPN